MRVVLLGLSLLAACAPAEEAARAAWLQSTLVADNRALFERDPGAAAQKLAKMASEPFSFLRGTSGQFVRDVLEPGPWHQQSRFGGPATARRLILGDAHLENVGTFHAGGVRLVVDFNDFDSATYGPFHLDVWRLCASIGVALREAEEATQRRWMRTFAEAYALEITRISAGGRPLAGDEAADPVLRDLLERADDEGSSGVALTTYTRLVDGQRVPFLGEVEPPDPAFIENRMVPVSLAERRLVEAALGTWRPSLVDPAQVAPVQLKGLARRLGAGVSSYPLPRYYALLEGPTPGVEDDQLIELREAGDPVRLPGVQQLPWPRFATNAHRVVALQKSLQAYLDDDPLLGRAVVAPTSFRVRARDGFQKHLSVSRLRARFGDGRWDADDLEAAFATIGRLLARAHAGALGSDGALGGPVIAAALDGKAAAFGEEAAAFGVAYARQILSDLDTFRDLLVDHGPLLGYGGW